MSLNSSARSLRLAAVALALAWAPPAGAQTFETVGTRALGMGGAFVAVADDATATWWNPAGLATGAIMDVVLARQQLDTRGDPDARLPAGRRAGTVIALTTPALGLSYYRLRLTEIRDSDATGAASAGRQEERADLPLRVLGVSQVGITVLQTVIPGLHVGTTLKYLRAGGAATTAAGGGTADDLLDEAARLKIESRNAFDLDVGVMASVGALRAGATVKNVRQPTFTAAGSGLEQRLDRQVRAGLAVDVAAAGGPPLILALDADLRSVPTAFGPRRNLAVGAEQWVLARRVGVRAGIRVDTLGERRPAGAAGVSIGTRSGLYVEGQMTRGGDAADRGWTVGVRVTF